MFNVDIDTGGTMTDALVSGGARPLVVKVETTPHDMTVSFVACLESAATRLGFGSLRAFLEQVSIIRWSSTVTSNVLAQRSGPKLGLIVSAGHERDLYCRDPRDVEAVVPSIIKGDHIAGLRDPSDQAEVLAVLKRLFDEGIRRVNVSLAGAFPDGDAEQRILRIIGEQFPDHYLGSIPALAGSDMLMRPDDASRTFYALINAYVHNSLAAMLHRAEDQVKVQHNWKGDILVGHLSGGVARIGKTKAVDTIESGPLFGTHASASVAGTLKLPRVLALDVGGTTAKASAVADGRVVVLPEGALFGIPVRAPMALLRSVALGGGSVARVEDGLLRLGPESMGAAPGPACYGLGGKSATLTDALVALGLINPAAFLDGRRVLDIDRAQRAIASDVAEPLGVPVATAAEQVKWSAVDTIAELARETMHEAGWKDASRVVLFAYGGNGPIFATSVADRLKIDEVRLFALGTVFSAYGSAIADVLHVYERALAASDGADEIGRAAGRLVAQARRDLSGEGFDPERAGYTFVVEGERGARAVAAGPSPPGGAAALLRGVARPQLLRLEARFPMAHVDIPPAAAAAGPAAVTRRSSALAHSGDLPVHAHDHTRGRALAGPLVVDGGSFTWYVGPGWTIAVDQRGDATLHRAKE